MFVPLKIMYPEADIPCIQLSLVKGLDPGNHIRLGKSLAELKQEGLLIIGSGFSFHNLNAFFLPQDRRTETMNRSFEKWLVETCSDNEISNTEREARLKDWESAPHARFCHPREEHLLPLHVCCGAADGPAFRSFQFEVLKKQASSYLWKYL